MMGDTLIMELNSKRWVRLLNSEPGALLQKISGAAIFYLYSTKEPPITQPGMKVTATREPVAIPGGSVWVRSESFTVMAYTPMTYVPNAGQQALDSIGNLAALQTVHRNTLVEAINEVFNSSGTGSNATRVETITITPTMLLEKRFLLNHSPVVSTVLLFAYSGITQRVNVDYIVVGNEVSWDGIGLVLLLEEGMTIVVTYVQG